MKIPADSSTAASSLENAVRNLRSASTRLERPVNVTARTPLLGTTESKAGIRANPLICTLPACGTLQPKFGVDGDHTTRTQRRSP